MVGKYTEKLKTKNNHARVKVSFTEAEYMRMKHLYQHGDLAEIAIINNATYKRVQFTWSERRGTKELVNAFIKFYDQREKYLDSAKQKEKAVAV